MNKWGLAGMGLLVGMTSIVSVASVSTASSSQTSTVTWLRPVGQLTQSQLVHDAKILKRRLSKTSYADATASVINGEIAIRRAKGDPPQSLLRVLTITNQILFRPVLCLASQQDSDSVTAPLPPCGATYATDASNLAVMPNSSAQGYSSNTPTPDPIFAGYASTPSSAPDYAHTTVLLPGPDARISSKSGPVRYVLGPAEMTGNSISSAIAKKGPTGGWEVNYSLKGAAGSRLWDQVAQENFHRLLGIEFDGVVQSAPLIQPSQTEFTSFGGQGTISGGNMTEADAKSLAASMGSVDLSGTYVITPKA